MFHKQNVRQPVATALLALLLALTSAFSSIGLSGWVSFRRQLAALDAQYTTVAYLQIEPLSGETEPGHQYHILDDGSYQDIADGTIIPSRRRVVSIAETAPGLLDWNTNVLTAAHTPNQKGFSSGAADPLNYIDVYDLHRYSMSVMAVRCIGIEDDPLYPDNYIYRFEWVEPVCRMAAYDLPEPGRQFKCAYYSYGLVSPITNADGTPFGNFEVGKTYLMRGDFIDFCVQYGQRWVEATEDEPAHMESYRYRYTTDNWEELTGMDSTVSSDAPFQTIEFLNYFLPIDYPEDYYKMGDDDIVGHSYPLIPNFYLATKMTEIVADGVTLTKAVPYVPEESWPFYAEYGGDWRDFLNTEEGRVWRDEIIPCCETNYDSVPVLLTDNIQSLSQFCKEEAALLEGRFITQEEYDRGDTVCMVSADYALYNGLQVGDTLTLDFYKPAYETQFGTAHLYTPESFLYTTCMPMVEENRLSVVKDYTIVGLYTAPVWPMDPDGHGFRGDTALAPKASAPEVVNAAEEDKVTPLLNTLVLKNGSIEEFEAYMAENGVANRFRYYDYGYSEMKSSIKAMEDSALRLALLGGAVFLIGAAVFLLAGFARMSASARNMRLLGASPRKVTGEMLSALLPLMAAGVIVGGALGGLLYGRVCEAVLSQTLAPDWPGLAVCAALQLAALSTVAAVWAALTARRGLMRRKQD